MEKLQRILSAEKEARYALRDARDRAAEIGKRAAADAERMHAEALVSSHQLADATRVEILRDADEEAARIATQAQHERTRIIAVAESRIDEAIRVVVAEIVG